MGYDAPRPGVFDYNNRIVGRWTLDTPVIGTGGVQQGDYTFITISDDGVRMKYEEIDGAGNPVNPAPPLDSLEWNIIYDWTDHGRTADMGIASLQDGKRYRITLEYYEKWSGAAIILTVGGTNFSFTDSPKQGAGPAFVDIPAIPYANTSLMLDGTLDLAGTTNPILEYYTYYEIRTAGRVEVSVDGGFTWEQGGMTDAIGSDTNFQWPSYSGRCVPGDCSLNDWRQMRHNLTRYVGRQIMIRFRLDRQTDNYLDQQYNNPFDSRFNNNGYFISWWVVDIRVADANSPDAHLTSTQSGRVPAWGPGRFLRLN
jgi:hypothetical protein